MIRRKEMEGVMTTCGVVSQIGNETTDVNIGV